MIRLSTIGMAALALAPALTAGAAEVSQADVDELVGRHLASRHIPGATIAVVREGQVVFAKGYGLSNVELSVPATKFTVFELASMTKPFTALATLMLIEDNKLSLDDRVTEILDGLPDAWNGITIRHLLRHTSGVVNYTSIDGFFDTIQKTYGKRELIGLTTGIPLDFAPGAEMRYSNTGYYLLGMVIEDISGQEYGHFLEERIFRPLDMTNTRFNDRSRIIDNRANGYRWNGLRLRNAIAVNPMQTFAAGGLVSTVLDLVKWNAALDAGSLLDRKARDLMWKATELGDGRTTPYGLGWRLDPFRSHRRVGHSGEMPGFSTYFCRFVDDELTIILLANLEKTRCDRIVESIAELYLPALREHAPKPIADTEPETTAFLRTVIEHVAQGKGERNWFTPKWQEFFFPDRIKEGIEKLGTYGELESFALMDESTNDGTRRREYVAVFGTVAIRCSFRLSADGKVAGIGLRNE